jgi:hypothetical protein
MTIAHDRASAGRKGRLCARSLRRIAAINCLICHPIDVPSAPMSVRTSKIVPDFVSDHIDTP